MEYISLFTLLISILLIAAVSRRIQGTIVTHPMIYVALGLLIGRQFLDLVPFTIDNEFVVIIAELTLIFVLATDASRINLRRLIRDHSLPVRLLGIGLPLTMILGLVVAIVLFPQLGFWEAAILAIVLTPTDAGLGQAVISNPIVPARIRQALNIESGLNDGIAMPFLILAIALALEAENFQPTGAWIIDAVLSIGLGLLVGVFIGFFTTRFLEWGDRSQWMSDAFQKIAALALILLSFVLAEMIGGNGFIAAFCMGVTTANLPHKNEKRLDAIFEHAEIEVQLLLMITFILFGAVMVPFALNSDFTMVWVYALLSLTLVRIVPVGISMIGSKIQTRTVGFLGWFGPRGIASILYIFTVFESESILGKELIYDVAMITVLISVFAHGLTAVPLARHYGRYMAGTEQTRPQLAEMERVSEMPVRTSPKR